MISKSQKKKILKIVELGIDNLINKQPDTHLNVFNTGLMLDLKGIERSLTKKLLKTIENFDKIPKKGQ